MLGPNGGVSWIETIKKEQTGCSFLCFITNDGYSLWGVFVFIFNKETKTANKTLMNNKQFMVDPPSPCLRTLVVDSIL